MEFTIKRAAFKHMQAAFDYYETEQQGLGDRFLDELDEAFDLIKSFPKGSQVTYKHYRQRPLRKFPYVIMYEERDTFIRITGIYHTSRKRRKR